MMNIKSEIYQEISNFERALSFGVLKIVILQYKKDLDAQ